MSLELWVHFQDLPRSGGEREGGVGSGGGEQARAGSLPRAPSSQPGIPVDTSQRSPREGREGRQPALLTFQALEGGVCGSQLLTLRLERSAVQRGGH